MGEVASWQKVGDPSQSSNFSILPYKHLLQWSNGAVYSGPSRAHKSQRLLVFMILGYITQRKTRGYTPLFYICRPFVPVLVHFFKRPGRYQHYTVKGTRRTLSNCTTFLGLFLKIKQSAKKWTFGPKHSKAFKSLNTDNVQYSKKSGRVLVQMDGKRNYIGDTPQFWEYSCNNVFSLTS